jgi:hypothetical protein
VWLKAQEPRLRGLKLVIGQCAACVEISEAFKFGCERVGWLWFRRIGRRFGLRFVGGWTYNDRQPGR